MNNPTEMGEFQEIPNKFLSISSSENRDSIVSLNDGEDEEFYEKIEAPKFVDFSLPDHYSPDDHYWFCLRVGCDRKHEEEMDSEAIYNNFVLRVMAARSPNIRLRKAFHTNSSRTSTKCSFSAPPKSSKPRLSRMALISSFSNKMAEDEKKVVLKPRSTPATKTKPVAAKYLTTPRNKKCTSDRTSFRSVQHPKPVNVEEPASRIVAKALVFPSPKKAIKVKTSSELRTPISKLCQGMNRLENPSQRQRVLGYSSKLSKNGGSSGSSRRQLSSQNVVQEKTEKPFQICKVQQANSGRSIKTKTKGKLSQQNSKKLLRSDETQCLKNKESSDNRKVLATKVTQESSNEEACTHPTVSAAESSDLLSPDDVKGEVNGRDELSSKATKAEEINLIPQPTEGQEIDIRTENKNITAESCAEPTDQLANNSSQGEGSGNDLEDGDDNKENAAASDGNRIPNNTLKKNGRKLLGVLEKCHQIRKKVTEAQDNMKETTEVKKPKATNPKPFRLRTDERGVLKESILDRRVDPLDANLSTPGAKFPPKHVNDIQKGSTIIGPKTPKGQERSKCAAPTTPETNKHHGRKLKSNAMQRLEKFRKLTASPLPKQSVRPQGVATKQEMISYLIPGQKLEVIPEASPEVLESRSVQRSSTPSSYASHGRRRLITIAAEPKFHSTHVPRSCSKKLK